MIWRISRRIYNGEGEAGDCGGNIAGIQIFEKMKFEKKVE